MHFTSCWSPCFWYNNVRDGSLACAAYTFFMSILIITYTSYAMAGGDTSMLWLPFFETDLDSSLMGAGGFVLFFFLLFVIFSVLFVMGVWTDIRGFMLPWLICMGMVITFQATFSMWLIFGYYIYLEVIFVCFCDWVWMALNIYCFFVVRSHYFNVKQIQSPDIEYLNTY